MAASRIGWSLAAAACIALTALGLALVFTAGRGTDIPAALPGGWLVAAGGPAILPDASGEIAAAEPLELTRDGVSVSLAAGSRTRLAPSSGAGRVALPELRAGSMEVTLAAAALLGDLELDPDDEVRLVVTPEGIRVVEGELLVGGKLLGPGEVLPWGRRSVAREAEVAGAVPAAVPTRPAPAPADLARSTGRVVDARDGGPLEGAVVRATFSRHPEGYPPSPEEGSVVLLATGADGSFTVPRFRPDDPLVELHLEVAHPDYLPLVHVIEAPPDLDGRRPFVTLALRPGLTAQALFLDENGDPLAGAAVLVHATAPRDRFVGEDAWDEGKTLRGGGRVVRYTSEDGLLRIGLEPARLVLLDPLRHLWDREINDVLTGVTLPPDEPRRLWREPFEVHTRPGDRSVYRLRDLDDEPVPDALVEVALDEMPVLRLHTGAGGELELAPWPRPRFPKPQPPVTLAHPREGTLTALSPLLYKRASAIAVPAPSPRLVLNGRLSRALLLRTTRGDGESRVPVPPHEFLIDRDDLTLTRRGRDGLVRLVGTLPEPGGALTISVRGHLPLVIDVPPYPPRASELDLGDLAFERGDALDVRFTGAPGAFERGRFLIADTGGEGVPDDGHAAVLEDRYPPRAQEYPLDGSRRVVAGGLIRGRWYRWAVEGSRVRSVAGEFHATDELLAQGLTIPLEASGEVETLLRGEVAGVDPEKAHEYRVVERYFGDGGRVTFASYPLAPDGTFGSARVLEPPAEAEVFVVHASGIEGVHARRGREADAWVFDLGRRRVEPLPVAIITFHAEGVGRVGAPGAVELSSPAGDHEVAIVERLSHLVLVKNLLPGSYELRWKSDERWSGGVHAFELESGELEHHERVVRRSLPVEDAVVRIEDGSGRPVPGVAVSKLDDRGEWKLVAGGELAPPRWVGLLPPQRDLLLSFASPGHYLLPVDIGKENRFRLELEDGEFLPAIVTLGAAARISAPIVLRRGARVAGVIADIDGSRPDGVIAVSWQDVEDESGDAEAGGESEGATAVSIRHGEAFGEPLAAGVFESERFPPGRHLVAFKLEGTEASARRVLELEEDELHRIGVVELEETRSVRGRVFLPDAEPAARAVVALVEPALALRLPQRRSELQGRPFSTRADRLGRFSIDGLPLDLRRDLALIARLDGWTDAVEDPIDLELEEHVLVLEDGTELVVDAGYRDRSSAHADFEFRLEYDDGAAEGGIDLGPVQVSRGALVFRDVTPGRYRLSWNLVEPHPAVGERAVEGDLLPGTSLSLPLRVDDVFCAGEAVLNGQRLERGWVLLTEAPDDPGATRLGRVRGGAFELPVPLRAESAVVALIPELTPVPVPDFARGEVLPVPYPDFRFDVKKRFLRIDYQAYNLTYELPQSVTRRYADIVVEFPHYTWTRNGFRREIRGERLEGSVLRLSLLQPGNVGLRFWSPDGFRHVNNIALSGDSVFRFGNPVRGR